jgi:hypothetical protein
MWRAALSQFNCNAEMDAFHAQEVNLPQSERDEMRARRNAGRTRLRTGLERDGHSAPETYSQGSYAMHTMVQDDECDYDIDDGAYFPESALKDAQGNALTPLGARERVCAALGQDDRLEYRAKVHNNCVRQRYPAGYHIDVPVYRVTTEGKGTSAEADVFELASGNAWQRSDARGVTKWFKDRVSELNGDAGSDGRQMRQVVRLTKAFARSRKAWKDETCSGIQLTRLVVDQFKASAGRTDLALRETWKSINDRIVKSQKIEHPVNSNNLADDGNECVKFFQGKLSDALSTLEVLDKECSRDEARKAWDSVFNCDFFGKQSTPTGNDDGTKGNKAAFVFTESKVDRRDDGGGRYGSWS